MLSQVYTKAKTAARECTAMWTVCALVLAVSALAHARIYERNTTVPDLSLCFHDDCLEDVRDAFSYTPYYEWEGYDGWYNNLAYPEWGGADMPMQRRTPAAYPDGVSQIVGENSRGNVLLISNASQHGLTGLFSTFRTALFTYFGQQVVEEMLDTQTPGCIPEYEYINIPKCHPLYDPDCRADRRMPFLRSRYDFSTGNRPRMQLNQITPWFDGGLFYGVTKAWSDALRAFKGGALATLDGNIDTIEGSLPIDNDFGLPLVNPPPPRNHSLHTVTRFWRLGNPRGNENPFLLTLGIFWFRVHNWWAKQLREYAKQELADGKEVPGEYNEDEWLYNRARQFTIATHQHIVYNEWLPHFIPRVFVHTGGTLPDYENNKGYSINFNRSGYNPVINPQIAHIFQSVAMRFGHTVVPPGIWRRERIDGSPNECRFGSPISLDPTGGNERDDDDRRNAFLRGINGSQEIRTWTDLESYYIDIRNRSTANPDAISDHERLIMDRVNSSYYLNNPFNLPDGYINNFTYLNAGVNNDQQEQASDLYFAIRTCNSFWNPQDPIRATGVDPMYLGMASQAAEREDNIITPDLRGKVFGPLEFSRRDLMAINIQRARDHGLPDFNSARLAYGLPRVSRFEDLNELYGVDDSVTENIEALRDVYNNDIDSCDIWACGLAETIPSDRVDQAGVPSGPGALFSAVLFDQFMRIRHGDRFWYENYQSNGIFTEEEFQTITQLTMKKLLIAVTNIEDGDISNTPFIIADDIVCPQPFQLSELYMDDCAALEDFDYYTGSDWQIPLIWCLCFLYIAIVILLLIMLAMYNQHRRQQILAQGQTARSKTIEGVNVTGGEGEVLVAWELKAGNGSEKRQVSMKTGPGKKIVLFSGSTILREVDLRFQTNLTLRRPLNDHVHFVLKIPHEYDIILRCQTALDRTAFIDRIQGYLAEVRIGFSIEEPTKREMLRAVYTKKDRQRLLENFFRSVFREGAQVGTGEIGETCMDILECELSRAEFAEAMSLKQDSLFVEQMYQLIDQDGNGFISFREFLDMIVVFAKGSPEDKLKLMFDMYDVDKNGSLHREDFKKMLKAKMELVDASVPQDQMDELIDSMFNSAGFQHKQELTFEDFNYLMRNHKEQLSIARLKVSGFDVPEVELGSKKTPEPQGEAAPSRYRTKETATIRAFRTIRKAYDGSTKGDPRAKSVEGDAGPDELPPTFDIPTQKPTLTRLGRYLAISMRFIENYRLRIFYLVLFLLVTGAIFVERAYYYSIEREYAGLRRIAGHGVTITRGATSAMMFSYSILLLTVARNFITYLRETIFNYYIPFDSHISFHKIVALTGLFFTIMHCIGHGLNFYHISTQSADDLTCIFREVYHRTHSLPKFSYWLFLTMTGFAGFVLTLVTVVIFVFATQYARRYTFRAFWVTHHFYIIFYILMFLHGSGRMVQDPLLGNFFLGPGIVYAIDQLISMRHRKIKLSVVRSDILPSQVIGVYFKRPVTFDYLAGQWVKIASTAQNPSEFHSFTLSSAPHEELLSLHIRVVGPWTYNFRERYNPANLQGKPFPKVYLDGPFGEGHQDWFRFEVAVLVGGGIGVTPFASILKELVYRFNSGARIECKKVFFIWVTRSQKQYEWFTDIIRQVEEADKKGLVEMHIFITQFFDQFDLRTTMLYICEKHFQKVSGRSLFTGLRSITHFGRPDFEAFFDHLQERYINLPKIGVFSCGPPGMTNGVENGCAATDRYEGPAFIHHFENF